MASRSDERRVFVCGRLKQRERVKFRVKRFHRSNYQSDAVFSQQICEEASEEKEGALHKTMNERATK